MLSVPHLIVIFLVALVVLGPEKLPQVARMLGKAMGDFRRITTDFRVQIEDEMREIERQARVREEAAAAAAAQPVPNAVPQLPAAEAPASPNEATSTEKPDGESHPV